MKKENKNKLSKIPLGIVLISVFYYIASIIYLITGILAFTKPSLFLKIPGANFGEGSFVFIYFGIFLVVLSGISLVLATGLLKRKSWARIFILAISVLMVLGGILSIIEKSYISSVNLIINLIIAIYLIINKKLKKFFSE